MKTKRDIYCEYGFWEAFFGIESQIIFDRTKRRLWDAFFVFLSSNNLFFDIPNQSVNSQTSGGKYLNELWQTKGGAGILFIPKEFPKIKNISDNDDNWLNSVYLTMLDTPTCKQLSEKFGIIVLNVSMIFDADHIFHNCEVPFVRGSRSNWSFLFEIKEKCPSISCCNSLVVVDRFVLKDKKFVFRQNIKPIFDAFLPESLGNGVVFSICIVTEMKCVSIEDKLSKLEKMVKKLRPKLLFRLNIFTTDNIYNKDEFDDDNIHDRSILTNNVILTTGVGFDIIDQSATPRRSTTSNLSFPFFTQVLQLNNNSKISYLTWIDSVLKEERKCRIYLENYWGERTPKHHLLDYYYEEEPIKVLSKIHLDDDFSDVFRNACSRY